MLVAGIGIVAAPAAVLAPTFSYADMPEISPQTLPTAQISPPATTTPEKAILPEKHPIQDPIVCECVAALRIKLGINIHGDADQLTPNIDKGDLALGDIILLRYGNIFHAAEIIGMDSEYLVHDFNYRKCKETIRFIPKDDPSIRGFYRPQ